VIIYQHRIFREDLRANPKVIYVFGDNEQRLGLAGQAGEMRGEPNAVGIRTKWYPNMQPDSFFDDNDYFAIKDMITDDWNGALVRAGYGLGIIVCPLDGLGTGLSELPTRAPQVYEFIVSLGLGRRM